MQSILRQYVHYPKKLNGNKHYNVLPIQFLVYMLCYVCKNVKKIMNIQLFVSLSANGNIVFAEDVKNEPMPEIVANFMQLASKSRNMIIGRKTLDLMLSNPMAKAAFEGIEIIVISGQTTYADGVTCMSSPAAAIDYCKHKGYDNALVVGGAQVYQAFLAKNYIREFYINILPLITAKGGLLVQMKSSDLKLELLKTELLSSRIVQLQYKAQ
jgi:dihydrofolate reductase